MENGKYRSIWNKLIESLNDKYHCILEDDGKDMLMAWVRRNSEERDTEVVLYYYVDRGDLEAHYFTDSTSLLLKEAAYHPVVHTRSCNVEMGFLMYLDSESLIPDVVDWFSVFFKEIDK